MKQTDIVLINPNRLFPPIAPVGIDCLETYLLSLGYHVDVLDLNPFDSFDRVEQEIRSFFSVCEPALVGISIRNIDDSSFFSSRFLLSDTKKILDMVRQYSTAPMVLGGVGFSVMPELVMKYLMPDYGIAGDGEEPLSSLVSALINDGSIFSIPGLLYWHGDVLRKNKPEYKCVPAKTGKVFTRNIWYFSEGGQIGIETKRGCNGRCIYCADPLSKGNRIRLRDPAEIAAELEALIKQGISCFHTCDSEFNRPPEHALEVCDALIKRGVHGNIRLYAYCSPVPFTPECAKAMRKAGFRGINFGVDHVNDSILSSLGRDYQGADVIQATKIAKDEGLRVMHDLLLGSPFETEETLKEVIEKEKRSDADCIGVSLGIRMYPGTQLYRMLPANDEKYLSGSLPDPALKPLFYVKPEKEKAIPLLCDLIGDDRRFFFQPLGEKYNYNYADNTRLLKVIREGARGAYWDILISMQERLY
jgi:radical SAM superfamily enzyme YgiQ (UPF0313 family)